MFQQVLHWLESGQKSAAEVVALCLTRIAEMDPQLKAWVEVCPRTSLAEGPLAGIPFGAKDIFETRDMTTEFGSSIYAGRKGQTDAALVSDLQTCGAVLLGKTQTTAFAYFDPAPTRNPHDLRRTPGGSSSGSAVAVAVGMVPFALGTQTQGSVLRPASFCGIAGFKPTFGLLPTDGVLPFAPSLDTAGLFTQTAGDMRLLWNRIGFASQITGAIRLGVPERIPAVEPPMQEAFRATVEQLRAEGVQVDQIQLPPAFWDLVGAVISINNYEGARTHEKRWREHGARLGRKLAKLVEEGLSLPAEEYLAALDAVSGMKQQMSSLFQEYPVILTPAAPGPAPLGLESTGDPKMNSVWTGLGVPAISVPMQVSSGLPMGLQLTAGAGNDEVLLDVAARVESVIAK